MTTKTESSKTEETKSAALTRVDAKGNDVDVDAAASASAANDNNNAGKSGFKDESANSTVFNRTPPSVNEGVERTPPQIAQNNQNQVPTESSRVARNELPKTASDLPFVGLIGMLSALGFVTLRYGTSLRF